MENPLEILRGKQLSAVTFVKDYLQLGFDANGLTTYLYPILRTENGLYTIRDNGYRDALCSIIGKLVSEASSDDKAIVIEFANGSQVIARFEDATGPEAATLHLEPGKPEVVWPS